MPLLTDWEMSWGCGWGLVQWEPRAGLGGSNVVWAKLKKVHLGPCPFVWD